MLLRGDPAAAPTLALAAALVAGLAPIHQFTMASAANDPLAIALAAVSTAAAVADRSVTAGHVAVPLC